MTTTSSDRAEKHLVATYRLILGKPVKYGLVLELTDGPRIETEDELTRIEVLQTLFDVAQRHRPDRIFLQLHGSTVLPLELGTDNVKRIIEGSIQPRDLYIGG